MLLHDDAVYLILQWLPVISLLRFKLVCKTWWALIESSDFIKQHLHRHHYGFSQKDKNHSLIHLVESKDSSPFAIQLISIDSFEEPNTCVRPDCSDLDGYLPVKVPEIVSYDGIICLNLLNRRMEQNICLWNPATKQLRFLPFTPSLYYVFTTVGFGFDVRNNDYKVVNLIKSAYKAEVYSLSTNSWRSLTFAVPFVNLVGNPGMPFNNGTCFFWWGYDSRQNDGILCFDFSSELFHSISFPLADGSVFLDIASVVCDKIACVFIRNEGQLDIWVLNEYGRVNQSWAKLYTIDPYSTIIDWVMSVEWLSMNGNYIFFQGLGQICRFNVSTNETKNLSTLESKDIFRCPCYHVTWGEFKESLVSVGEGNMWLKKVQ